MDFSKKIRNRLLELEMKPIDLARATGYSPQYIYELLKKEKRWNLDNMERVCESLDMKIDVYSVHRKI